MTDRIEYSSGGYKGVLYGLHEITLEAPKVSYYQMSIFDKDGHEVLHAYNATPKTAEELKQCVDEIPDLVRLLKHTYTKSVHFV